MKSKIEVGDLIGYSKKHVTKEMSDFKRKLSKIPRKKKKDIIKNKLKELESVRFKVINIQDSSSRKKKDYDEVVNKFEDFGRKVN